MSFSDLQAATALDAALTESRSLRAQHMTRTDVLDRVKALSLLSDGVHATTELVANYYEVDVETVKKLVQRNRAELDENGYEVLKGDRLRDLKRDNLSLLDSKTLALFTRRTILNVGQLLKASLVAEKVRSYLLDVEQIASPEVRSDAIRIAEESAARIKMLGVAAETGLVDRSWASVKVMVHAARGLGEEPEVPAALLPLYVPDFLKGKGLTAKEINSEQSWFGRRAADLGAEHGYDVPEKRPRDQINGTVRETRAWRGEHLPLFELVWEHYYAEKYARPLALELGAA